MSFLEKGEDLGGTLEFFRTGEERIKNDTPADGRGKGEFVRGLTRRHRKK